MLLDIQQYRPDLVAPDIDVINDYGISRAERRVDTTRDQAAKVPEYVIIWTNHWNIREEDVVHGHMRVVYSERKKCWIPFWHFHCRFDAYCDVLLNPIVICGSIIRWVS